MDQISTMDGPRTLGEIITASIPAAMSAGLFAIGALLVTMQVQTARIEAAVQQTAQAVQELKTDAKEQLTDLEKRVRVLEINDR